MAGLAGSLSSRPGVRLTTPARPVHARAAAAGPTTAGRPANSPSTRAASAPGGRVPHVSRQKESASLQSTSTSAHGLVGRGRPAAAASTTSHSAARHVGRAAPPAAGAVDAPAALLLSDGGPPRWMSPLPSPPTHASRPDPATLPLLLFLPGIDGVGLAAWPAFEGLAARFDVRFLGVPADDRTGFEGLVGLVVEALQAEAGGGAAAAASPPTRPVYVAGESFGGTLALAVAARAPALVDRVVVVNPATSFSRSPWAAAAPVLARAPPRLYQALPLALAPALGNPLAILAGRVGRSGVRGLPAVAAELAAGAAGLVPQLTALAAALPAPTLEWRLRLLAEGEAAVNGSLGSIRPRVLAVGGRLDTLLPSADEVARLAAALPRGNAVVLPAASHACLQEAGVDLVRIMDDAGFYARHRRMSGPAVARADGRGAPLPPPPLLTPAGAIAPLTPFHPADPIELPTLGELESAAGRATRFIRATSSPVFFSADARTASGMAPGLGGLPTQADGRPLLFVGNHTTLALDMGVMVEELLRERGLLVRGLAHPIIFSGTARGGRGGGGEGGGGGASPPPPPPPPSPSPRRRRRAATANNGFEAFMTEYGAVPVGGRNFHRLLASGQAVLLYPGGVREAYKRRGEAYRLFWPEGRDEFIRMAAKHGAVVVPFACVGPEDSLRMVADADDLTRLPVIGPAIDARARAAAARVRPARVGVAADAALDDGRFLAPLVVPGAPERMYFAFRAPIRLEGGLVRDRAAAAAMYARVRGEVEAAIAWLQAGREGDAYRSAGPRLAYEAVQGRPAPTFDASEVVVV